MHDIEKSLIDHFPAWPLIVLIICIVLRKQIKELLNQSAELLKRIDRFSWTHKEHVVEASAQATSQTKAGVTAGAEQALPAGTGLTNDNTAISADVAVERDAILSYGKGVAVVQERVESIISVLERVGFGLTDAETTNMLIRQIAAAQSLAFFERTYVSSSAVRLPHWNLLA